MHATEDGRDDVIWLARGGAIRAPARPRPGLRAAGPAAAVALACLFAPLALWPAGPVASVPASAPAARQASAALPADASEDRFAIPVLPRGPSFGAQALAIPFDAVTGIGSRELEAAAEDAPGRDPEEVLRFGPMRVKRGIVETVVRAARLTGSDPALLMAIADKESSFAPAVRAGTSSAEGLFQFIDRTWMRVVHDFGADHGLAAEAALVAYDEDGYAVADPRARARILALRRDPFLSAVLAAEMLKADAARIGARIGRALTNGEIYVAHFLGPEDAALFLGTVVGRPSTVAASLLPRPARANRPIFYAAGHRRRARGLSVAQVHQRFEDMIGLRTSRYQGVSGVAGALAYAEAGATTP